MIELLESWANINSGSDNLPGLERMLNALTDSFAPLGGQIQALGLPPRSKVISKGERLLIPSGRAFRMTKRPEASLQVLLAGHMDTVFSATSPFQTTTRVSPSILRGPGVTDMKGGLVVMLMALKAFESSPFADQLGWEVLIVPDEEVGSAGSHDLLVQAAQRNDLGLLFEPSLPDGALVSERKGSASFTVVAKGRSAHAGRDFASGRNAISSLSRFIAEAETLNDLERGLTLNIGYIEGGGPGNIVPDSALCRLNVRMRAMADLTAVQADLRRIISERSESDGVVLQLHEHASHPPKAFDAATRALFDAVNACSEELGERLTTRASGGVCDGNTLAAHGLPTLDTLGVVGDHIHTDQEYVLLDSLHTRAALVTQFLTKLAKREVDLSNIIVRERNHHEG